MVANGRHRKKTIFPLDHKNGKIEGHANLKHYITGFYKGLFGEPEQSSFSLDPNRTEEVEIKKVIFEREHNEASGPMVFW
jgi:hypothetical protein